jgi:hypothetical protein
MNDQDRTSLDLLTVLTAMWASDPTLTERAAEWMIPNWPRALPRILRCTPFRARSVSTRRQLCGGAHSRLRRNAPEE